jgi:phosphoribosylformylglycinamidine synthase
MGWLARVYVTPKTGVLDPQGKAVQHSLHTLGYPEVGDVRIGKYLEVRLVEVSRESAEVRVREMCERLLANRVIEDFRFEIETEPKG